MEGNYKKKEQAHNGTKSFHGFSSDLLALLILKVQNSKNQKSL